MSFIRNKTIAGRKYAYEITAYWDQQLKKSRQKSVYLGVVDENNNVLKKGMTQTKQEKLQLDFGDGFLLHEFLKKSSVYPFIKKHFHKKCPEIIALIIYRLSMQSAMYNAPIWYQGNVISELLKNIDLSSQTNSRILAFLGQEDVQRSFFKSYLNSVDTTHQSVIIDSTSLPNQINHHFSAWGYADSSIEKQFRFLCVVDQVTKTPLFYRFLPGNLLDVSTLKNTIAELHLMGVKNNFALLDAGYFSQENILELYQNKIDFLTRLPASCTIYKDLIRQESRDIECIENAVKYGTRILFVKQLEIDLYGHKAFSSIVLDIKRKSKEVHQVLMEHLEQKEKSNEVELNYQKAGIMILVGSKSFAKEEVVSAYYLRQSVEQIFGFFKDDLDSLPIRRHNENTIKGYLFLQFITLIIFIQLRQKLQSKYTVEQALLHLRNLKCKVFESSLLVQEASAKQKEIFGLCDIDIPKYLHSA